ncbi:Lissencephaly-1 [Conoideocrella luteorostrata]|uniref:Lissencephaly-1 n=1 Tax=Conoideocrella luteorostrata TaxID=1105319 RepID=A0AAJ0CEZ8_9HYPO|nr:Lissencephaly-1 [Conoideocrella luteorostrata]
MQLESRNTVLQSELDGINQEASKQNQDPTSWLPTLPPRYSLQSHKGNVNCVSFHPIFSSIASGSDDCTIKIWDWEFGELEKTIKGHTQAVRDLDYGGPKGGILLASCSSDLTIKLWDPANEYKNIRTLQGHDHIICSARFIPFGDANGGVENLLISASGDQTLKVWNVGTGHCLKTLRGHTDWVRSVCPSIEGRFLLSAGNDWTARLWDISDPNPESKLTLMGHAHGINCCAIAPATAYGYLAAMAGSKAQPPSGGAVEFVATGSRDKTIKLWDARGTCLKTLTGHNNWVTAVLFHPGGKYLLSVADDKTLRYWDLSQEGQCIKVLEGIHEQFITCFRWAPSVAKDISTAKGYVHGANMKTDSSSAQIRCVVATGSMDMTVKIFTN